MSNIIKHKKSFWPHVYELRCLLIMDSNELLPWDNFWYICVWLLWKQYIYFWWLKIHSYRKVVYVLGFSMIKSLIKIFNSLLIFGNGVVTRKTHHDFFPIRRFCSHYRTREDIYTYAAKWAYAQGLPMQLIVLYIHNWISQVSLQLYV